MEWPDRDVASVRAMLARMHDADPGELHLEHRALRGGLESASVTRLAVRYRDHVGKPRVHTMVVKRLAGQAVREASVYQALLSTCPALAPRLLATDRPAPDTAVLYLEALRPASRWPWREVTASRSVLERVALLHQSRPPREALADLSRWDYEKELLASARRTLEQLERFRGPAPSVVKRGRRWVRRLVEALPAVRRQLLAFSPLREAVIHGDLHSGNVILRQRGGRVEPVLLDWGRARIGSPLEDVSSWLQSLGGWEPETRRRHDTLFASYLAARGMERRLGRDLRAAYWLAGASNALAGALSYHLWVMTNARSSTSRMAGALRSIREWLRILRRADACWS
jgi:aminoglycoside phosphotransferase (APT) family kinase protein